MFRYCLLLRFLTPYTPSRARLRSSFGAEAATLAARFVAAAGSSFGPCRDTMDSVGHRGHRDAATRRSYRTPCIGWTGELIFHCHLHTSLGGCYFAKETLQSSRAQWMNLQFIILGPLWTSNQQAALFYSGLDMFRPSEWQSISMIS